MLNIQNLHVFVASPGDVAGERAALGTVIQDFDQIYRRLNVGVNLIGWENDVIPDFIGDPQNVINSQINFVGIDFFIGIVWRRLGTPTPRTAARVVEEVNRTWPPGLSMAVPGGSASSSAIDLTIPPTRKGASSSGRHSEFQGMD